jgi:hypothetical protein
MAGGGIGEAALIGAAVGGGSALIRGEDPLKAALLGGALGGAGGAFFGPSASAGSGASGGAGANAGQAAGKLTSMGAQNVAANGAINTVPGMTTATYGAATPTAAAPAGAGIQNVAGQGAINVARAGEAAGAGGGAQTGFFQGLMDKYAGLSVPQKIGVGVGGSMLLSSLANQGGIPGQKEYDGPLSFFKYDPRKYAAAYSNGGGITDLDLNRGDYLAPPVTMMRTGGISDLGDYSDGGRLLRGPGDGVSDSIPARIGQKREARLADGEFVIPARIVSELGNGSTDAGARQLYAMMNRIQSRRNKTVGKGKVAVDSKARKLLPA